MNANTTRRSVFGVIRSMFGKRKPAVLSDAASSTISETGVTHIVDIPVEQPDFTPLFAGLQLVEAPPIVSDDPPVRTEPALLSFDQAAIIWQDLLANHHAEDGDWDYECPQDFAGAVEFLRKDRWEFVP